MPRFEPSLRLSTNCTCPVSRDNGRSEKCSILSDCNCDEARSTAGTYLLSYLVLMHRFCCESNGSTHLQQKKKIFYVNTQDLLYGQKIEIFGEYKYIEFIKGSMLYDILVIRLDRCSECLKLYSTVAFVFIHFINKDHSFIIFIFFCVPM